MPYYYHLGTIPKKRHTQFRQPNGALYHEELVGIHGFTGIQSLLYHLHPPTQVYRVSPAPSIAVEFEAPGTLRHRHLRTAKAVSNGDAIAARIPLMANADVCISVAQPSEAMTYWYRFAHGDEVIFIHDGSGTLESQYGTLSYRPGDYLVIPTGVMWRILPDMGVVQRMLIIEAQGHIEPPARYLNRYGQLLEHAPYAERDLRPPETLTPHDEVGEFEVRVKAHDRITSYFYHHHPLDIVGWDGYLYPYAFNIADFEPITGRIHQPPSVHQTFEAPGFVICSFVPRLFDYHPLAIPAPYNHSNVDSDEVLYYVEGNFMSRKGIERSSMTIHPRGVPHGPHPGCYEESIKKERTDELAVMIDTFRPLKLTQYALDLEDSHYPYSWVS
ncbi:MAG TPA: homogentisate 1,2-dioxygenase [Leptolyngbyaceae cyanobacterium M33_DOE_097]|uniref:Homogentisate 1,2-dioxygenase n=1 Tax=Oscillatoriales cyanobacterium SpSt-418 TaxID=2282169 RepID=A0A7C3KEY0_9CYAN|nr:homogentisate 1,2-dioxygenase [Leptolyngbyaceae cyanobacterium M33_DOE_097]